MDTLEDVGDGGVPDEAVSVTVPESGGGKRADRVLADLFPEWSRERLQGCFDAGNVWRDGQLIQKKTRVATGEVLTLVLPVLKPAAANPVAMPLEVLYEDEAVVVVNKESGLVVHPGNGVDEPTLVHGMLHYTGGGLALAGGEERPGVVHRLDRDTSGAIIFAKTDEAYYALTKAFAGRALVKEYLALICGSPKGDSGSIQKAIDRHPVHRVKMAVSPKGRHAHTDWQVLARYGGRYALLRCRIHTGRTHQIRVHLSDMGCPIWGDTVYGWKPAKGERNPPPRFLLHAWHLIFPHPDGKSRVEVWAKPPEVFSGRLAALGDEFGGEPVAEVVKRVYENGGTRHLCDGDEGDEGGGHDVRPR